MAWQGKVTFIVILYDAQGLARQGWARLGGAWQGKARYKIK